MTCKNGICIIDSSPFICVDGLAISYDGRTILQDIHFQSHRCSITAIIGPSGSGKSSFLIALNRLTDEISRCQVTGSIRIGELDVMARKLNLRLLRRKVGMIFQRPNPFPMSTWQNLEVTLKESGITNKQERADRAEQALRNVGLWNEIEGKLHQSALRLSGGQQQRLCIARGICVDPEVVLFDEPCSSLDPLSTEVIEDLIQKLRDRLTVIIVTHNLAQARRIADHTTLFWTENQRGYVLESGPTEQLFSQPKCETTGFYVNGRLG
jgi:phosphate transport system ATP-binding protein